MIKH
jgi:DNA mismatch repair protein MSH6